MERTINILTIIFVAVALVAGLSHFVQRQRLSAEIAGFERISALQVTPAEIDFINRNLNRRAAGDCKLERTLYGFKCIEFKSGKTFRIFY